MCSVLKGFSSDKISSSIMDLDYLVITGPGLFYVADRYSHSRLSDRGLDIS